MLDTWVCWQPCALGFCCQLMISVGSLWTWAWPGAWQWLVGSCPQMQMSPWLMSEGCEGWAVSALAFSDTHLFTAQHGKTHSLPAQLPFLSKRVPSCLVCTSSMFVTFLLIQSLGPVFSRELSSASEVKPCQFATSFSGAGIFSELC